MTNMDRAKNKVEELRGRAKQTAGSATGDSDTEREGRFEEAKANLKQAGNKLKDAFRRT
jgi:uncharacterized protein YjbJ (UPF0337 family)